MYLIEETVHLALEVEKHKSESKAESDENGVESETDEDNSTNFFTIFNSPANNKAPRGRRSLQVDTSLIKEELLNAVELELANYLSNPANISYKQEDPLLWWRENKHLYPRLVLTARKYPCVCATSTPSKRIFSNYSVAIHFLTAKLSKLNDNCLKSQILIHNSMKGVCLTVANIMNGMTSYLCAV